MEPYNSDDIKRKKRKSDHLLKKLLGAVPEVKAALIISIEGLPIASALPVGVNETKVAAMNAALLSLAEKAIIEMRKGDFDQLYIKGSEGYLLVMQAGPSAVLTVSTTKDVRLGLILLDCRRTCEKISGLLSNGDDFDDDNDDDKYPYPYILKPPEPPGDLDMAVQLQVNKFTDKEPDDKINCPYCGMVLTIEEWASHNCAKTPKDKNNYSI
ncbi:MAG: roadblock/LC7 domain-containing protein [Candidatus Hermodarchaeota archaeon]